MSAAAQANLSDEDQIRALVRSWSNATALGDLDAQLALMTEDVLFFSVGSHPVGREAFAENFAGMVESYSVVVEASPQEITVTGDTAVLWNHLEITMTPRGGGEQIQRSGNALSVLRRGPDGRWRLWRDANLISAAG